MNKILAAVSCVLAGLLCLCVLAILIQRRLWQLKLEKQKNDFLKQWNEHQKKQEEILKNAQKTKENLHTGNNDSDFNNSLNILQNLAEGRKKDDSD